MPYKSFSRDQEKFENTIWVVRSPNSKKYRNYNGQKNKDKKDKTLHREN